jgi:hypothetical protein
MTVVADLHFGDELPDHPSSEELAAYVNGSLAAAGRGVVEEHLIACRACREDVTLARRLSRRRHIGLPRQLVMPAAAAAAVVALIVLSQLPGRSSIGEEPLRSEKGPGRSEAASTIQAVSPSSTGTIDPGDVVFTWRNEPGQLLYRLSLTDDGGRELWFAQTTDTTLRLPPSVSLDRGRTYFWTVDALAPDGRSLTSRTQRFSTAP